MGCGYVNKFIVVSWSLFNFRKFRKKAVPKCNQITYYIQKKRFLVTTMIYKSKTMITNPRMSSPSSSSSYSPSPTRPQKSRKAPLPTPSTTISRGVSLDKLNWLNVADSIKLSLYALDSRQWELMEANAKLEKRVRGLERWIKSCEEENARLKADGEKERREATVDVGRIKRLVDDRVDRAIAKRLNADFAKALEDHVANRVMEETKKSLQSIPEEVRATLKRVENSSLLKNPDLSKRVEALEDFKESLVAKAAARARATRTQRVRLEDAITTLRKLSM